MSHCLLPHLLCLAVKLHLKGQENTDRTWMSSLKWNYSFIPTEPSPPVQIAVYQVSSQSLSLRWDPPAGEVESYIVTCCHEGKIVQEMTTDTNNLTLSNLSPGVCYSLQVSAQLRNGIKREPAVTSAHTSKLNLVNECLHFKVLFPKRHTKIKNMTAPT